MNFVPTNIVDDLANPDCVIELSPRWKVDVRAAVIWLYAEPGQLFNCQANERGFAVITALLNGPRPVRDVVAAENETPPVSLLVRLWSKGVIRIRAASCANEPLPRYRWLVEHFGQYARIGRTAEGIYQQLSSANICIVGAGGLGSMLALQLAAVGIGAIRIVDGDRLELDNLPRQMLYDEADIGQAKVELLRNRLIAHNSSVRVEAISRFVDSQEAALQATQGSDFVVLCADHPRYKIRRWIGRASLVNRVPYLAMAGHWIGPISVPFVSPCFACQARNAYARLPDPEGYLAQFGEDTTAPRPSFSPRPVLVSAFMAASVINYLGGIDRESLLYKKFQVAFDGSCEEQQVIRYRDCEMCSLDRGKVERRVGTTVAPISGSA